MKELKNRDILFAEFIEYLQLEKNSSQHTIDGYKKDLLDFFMFMDEQILQSLSALPIKMRGLYLN